MGQQKIILAQISEQKIFSNDMHNWYKLAEKKRGFVKLLVSMYMQLKFKFILTYTCYNKAAIDN
jgi:hypothetical protein